jgi:hypothetical protein
MASLKKYIVLIVIFDFLMVGLWTLFSPPMESVNLAVGVPMSLLDRFPVVESLFFHSLAMPLAAVLALVTMGVFGISGREFNLIKYSIVSGCLLSSVAMISILVLGDSLPAYYALVAGIGVGVAGAVLLFVSLWPRRSSSPLMGFKGRDLTLLAMWLTLGATLVSVAAGMYAAMGNTQWNQTPLISGMPALEVAHENLVIALVDVALVVLMVKWFKADGYSGTTGLFVKIGLFGIAIGVPAVTATTLVSVYTGFGVGGGTNVFAGILMQASLFVMCAIMYGEVKRLRITSPLGVLRESLTFGLLFVLFWVNVSVTLPGIYVAANANRFSGQYLGYYYEQVFVTGHEHALVTLTAISLLMLVSIVYGVRGKLGALAGLTATAGYVVATAANLFYIFFLIPDGPMYVDYIGAGIGLMMLGSVAAIIGLVIPRAARGTPP